jgi:pimeloyl-ACP methyl ester carboxylesterase
MIMTSNTSDARSTRSITRMAGRVALVALASVLAGVLLLLGVLLLWSPGKAKPILDQNGKPLAGSISEKIRVDINGVRQGMFVEGANAANPVLLFVHGGPGMPTHFLTHRYPTGLEQDFTVVWWEQRGAGFSNTTDVAPETLTVEQLIADTIAVTNYLRERFGQEKIYLMGHSWGSFLAIQVAARAPELYNAYIGVGQVSYQLQSEKRAYDYMLEQYRQREDTRMVRRLEAVPVTMAGGLPAGYNLLRDEAMHGLGVGTTRDMRSVITGIFLRSWFAREYTLGEKLALWRGKVRSRTLLWDSFIATDLTHQVTSLDLPVYFFHGVYDYTACYPEAKSFFEGLTAPRKGFYTFADSAHSPMHEEPDRMRQILREDVLAGSNRLADAR